MTRTLLTLAAVACTATACIDTGTPADPPPGEPIEAPLPGDLDVPADSRTCTLASSSAYTYAWDDAGHLTAAAQLDGAGEVLVDHAFTYDEAGRLLRWASTTPDGVVERTLERDEAGQIVAWAMEPRGLRVTVERTAEAITVAATGELYVALDDTLPPGVALDDVAPGWAQAAPRMELVITYVAARWANDEETLASVLTDAHLRQVTTLDADGAPLRTLIDVEGDGADDITYGEAHTAETRTTTLTLALEGFPAMRTVETLDAAGDVVVAESFEDDALTRRVTYERAADHVFEDRDEDADGDVELRSTIFFNALGNRVLKYDDRGADGRPDWRKRYVYDEATGQRLFDERDSNVDGRVDERWDYAYDGAGRLVEERISNPTVGGCGATW